MRRREDEREVEWEGEEVKETSRWKHTCVERSSYCMIIHTSSITNYTMKAGIHVTIVSDSVNISNCRESGKHR